MLLKHLLTHKNVHHLIKKTLRGTIDTLEGKMTYKLGDYIVKNVTGETYVCEEEIFKETYDEII